MKTNKRIIAAVILVLLFVSQPSFATSYHYDSLHRLSKVTYNDGMVIAYDYDASGNRSQRIITVLADFDFDRTVNLTDFARFTSRWLETNCAYPDHCDGTDFDWSTEVDIEDLLTFVVFWLYNTTP